MQLEAIRRLAGVADRPHALVELEGDFFNHRLVVDDLDVLEHLLVEAELLGEQVHDFLIGLGLEEGLEHLFAPLERAVRGGDGTDRLVLSRCRQHVGVVSAVVHDRRRSRVRVYDDEQFELVEGLLHVRAAGLRVRRVSPEEDRLQQIRLIDVRLVLENAVAPPRQRNAGGLHQFLVREAAKHVVVRDIPDAGPVPPRTFREAIVARQRSRLDAEVGRALDVVVSTEDIGATAGRAHIAERELQNAVGAHVAIADRVLGGSHAPDQRRGLVVGECPSDTAKLRTRNAGDVLNLFGRPLLHLIAHVLHAPDALVDEVLVFPAILENVIENAPDQRDIGAGAEAHELGGMSRGTRETRIADDERRVVLLLGPHQELHGDGMCLGRIAADHEHRLGVLDIVVGVGHGAVAPGLGYAGDSCRVADACLVVSVVGAPECVELAEQV